MPSRRHDFPVELASGKLVCGRHYQTICRVCRVDYSLEDQGADEFDDEEGEEESESDSDSDDDEDEHESNEDEDQVEELWADSYVAKRFFPPTPTDSPRSLFAEGYTLMPDRTRYVRITNPRELLIYVDGACVEKGQDAPRGGCAFVFRPDYPNQTSSVSFRLETLNPAGDTETVHSDARMEKVHIGDRARLRATVAAFQHQPWYGEGFKRIVIATDSLYVVSGITDWVATWRKSGWRTNKGVLVKNHDIWQLLLSEVQKFHRNALHWFRTRGEVIKAKDVEVLFWLLPRELNRRADLLAKKAAATKEIDAAFSLPNLVQHSYCPT